MSIHSSAIREVSCGLCILNLLVLQIYMAFQEKQDRTEVSNAKDSRFYQVPLKNHFSYALQMVFSGLA